MTPLTINQKTHISLRQLCSGNIYGTGQRPLVVFILTR